MSSNYSIKSFRDAVQVQYDRYDSQFAGRPQANRDLEVLDDIIAKLQEQIQTGRSNTTVRNTPAFVELLQTAIDNLTTYQAERTEIARLQQNPQLIQAAEVSSKANRLFAIYSRHFAQQNRATRDPGLLQDLIDELDIVKAYMEKLITEGSEPTKEDLVIVRQTIKLYKKELDQIQQAQLSGGVDNRISILATTANEQFRIYAAQFAGRSRVSRRRELLERIIDNLTRIHLRMEAIQTELKGQDGTSEANDTNLQIVTEHLRLYNEELEQIIAARNEASKEDVASALGAAANEIMDEYRKHFSQQTRVTRDLTQLGDLCDGLWDISRQMEAIEVPPIVDHNLGNLHIVNETWTSYELEYTAIDEAIKSQLQ